jgi:hypothetical protein
MDTPKTPKAKKPVPTRIDANGQSIPVSIIRPEILKQDAIVSKTITGPSSCMTVWWLTRTSSLRTWSFISSR